MMDGCCDKKDLERTMLFHNYRQETRLTIYISKIK